MKMIDQHVSKYLAEIEEQDREEEQANFKQADILQEKVQKLMKRKGVLGASTQAQRVQAKRGVPH